MKNKEKDEYLKRNLIASMFLTSYPIPILIMLHLWLTLLLKEPKYYIEENQIIIDFFLKYEMFIHMGFVLFLVALILITIRTFKKLKSLTNTEA